QPNVNANNQQVTQGSPQPTAQPIASATPTPAQAASAPTPAQDNVPQRKIRIVTPLYEATLDTHGAVATSWIITRNKNTGREIYAANSTRSNPEPLELIPTPPAGVALDQLFRPLQTVTDEPTIDALLSGRNFR